MSLEAKTGAFSTGTQAATNTVQVTGVGFEPSAILFWWTGRTDSVDAIGRTTVRRGVGFATSPTERFAVANRHDDAVDTTDGSRRMVGDACVIAPNLSGGDNGALDLQSMDADGFTLVVDTQMPADLRVHYLALGGGALTGVKAGFHSEADAQATTTDVTGVGFSPNVVLLASNHSGSTSLPHGSSEARMMLGFAAGTALASQAVVSSRWEEPNDPTVVWGYCDDSRIHALAKNPANHLDPAHISAFGADGYTLTWDDQSVANADQAWIYLALAVEEAAVGTFQTRTDLNDIEVTGVGFQPAALLVISQAEPESTLDTVDEKGKWVIGGASGPSDRGAQMGYHEDAQTGADLETAAAVEHDAIYVSPTAAHAIDGLVDLVSFDAGGFTATMDDAESAARFVAFLALGETPAGGGGGATAASTDTRSYPRGRGRGIKRGVA